MTGHVNRPMIETIAPDLHERHIYMCGPAGSWTPSRGSYGR